MRPRAGPGRVALAVQFEERIIPFQSEIDSLEIVGEQVLATVTVSIKVPPNDVFRARLLETSAFDDDGKVAELVIAGEDQGTLDEFLG